MASINFNSPKMTKMCDVFPQAVITSDLIFVSGMPGLDQNTGQIISAEFEEQVRQSFLNIKTILEDAGSSLSKVLKTTIFMAAGNDFAVINKVYKEFFHKMRLQEVLPRLCPSIPASWFQLNALRWFDRLKKEKPATKLDRMRCFSRQQAHC